jgi:hypothetical protein
VWAVVCVGITSLVAVLQTQSRAPLTWDEANRVRAGQELVLALRQGGLPAVWTWANEQTFYPFGAPLLHGLVLFVTDSPIVAAWAPPLAAFAALGLLAGALARELQLGSTAAWIAALLCWLTPLYARLSAGGFVDTLGACASVATIVLVLRSLRTSRHLDAVLAGLVCTLAFLIRYDFGLVLIGTVVITLGLTSLRRDLRHHVNTLAIMAGTSLILMELWFIPNSDSKWAQFSTFSSSGRTLSELTVVNLDHWAYYVNALWYDQELGMSSLLVDLIVLSVCWAVFAAIRNVRIAVLVAFIGVWYICYSAAGARSPQFSRYMASVLPFGFVLLAMHVTRLATPLRQALTGSRVTRPLAWIAVLVCGLELVRQTAGPSGIAQQFWFVRANPPAAQIVEFMQANLSPGDSSLVFIGETNEVSPDLVRLTWMRASGRQGQQVTTAEQLPSEAQSGMLYDVLRRKKVDLVLAVRVGPGSRFDTLDNRVRFGGEYERYAAQLESSSNFTAVAHLELDGGRLGVTLLRVGRRPLPE